jgi:pimeloyl-ACP methyl ester carboxylesterase
LETFVSIGAEVIVNATASRESPPTSDATQQRLILIPGLGVDQRLFIPQQEVFPRLEIPAFIPHRDTESLPEYAARLAATIETKPGEPYYHGGASYGGMLALEMASALPHPPRAVFLIASCRAGRCVGPHARPTERVARYLPDWMLRTLNPLLLLLVPDMANLTPLRRKLFRTMIRDSNLPFVRWGSRVILDWSLTREPPCRVYQIHGEDDTLIPLKNVQPDRVVPGVGHLLNMNRWDVVNEFLIEHMRD